jgi:hypothetical protein
MGWIDLNDARSCAAIALAGRLAKLAKKAKG